jgi:hypothetical protein
MIERYAIKVSPAISQDELRKKLETMSDYDPAELDRLHKMKAKIEVICDFADLRELRALLESRSKNRAKESDSPQISTSEKDG